MLCRLDLFGGVRGGGGAESSADKAAGGQGKEGAGADANGSGGGISLSPRTQAEQVWRMVQPRRGIRDAAIGRGCRQRCWGKG